MAFGQNILYMMRRPLLIKDCSRCVMKTSPVWLPYNNTDFTPELNIHSSERLEICELTHSICNRRNAALVLFNLQLISPPVRQCVLTRLVYPSSLTCQWVCERGGRCHRGSPDHTSWLKKFHRPERRHESNKTACNLNVPIKRQKLYNFYIFPLKADSNLCARVQSPLNFNIIQSKFHVAQKSYWYLKVFSLHLLRIFSIQKKFRVVL